MKICMIGPPCVGKSFYSESLAEHYNVPHIHMEKLLSELLSWDQEKEDRYHAAIKARDDKIRELTEERENKKKEAAAAAKAEADAAKAAKAADEMGSEGSDKPGASIEPPPADDAPAEGEEGEEPAEQEEGEKEPPIEVELEADSDDDFAPIEIKEKVKKHIREHGL